MKSKVDIARELRQNLKTLRFYDLCFACIQRWKTTYRHKLKIKL